MEDEALARPYDGALMRRLLVYMRPYWLLAVVVVVLSLASQALFAGRGFVMKYIVDDGLGGAPGVELNQRVVWIAVLMLLAVEILRWLSRVVLDYLTVKLGQSAVYRLRLEVFSKLQRLSLRYFDRNPAGRLITRVTNDVEALNELFSAGIVSIFTSLFMMVVLIGCMLYVHVRLALVSLAILPGLVVISVLVRRRIRPVMRVVRRKLAGVNAFLQEHFLGMRVTQMFRQEERKAAEFSKINLDYRDEMYRAIRLNALIGPITTVLFALGTGVLLWYVGWRYFVADPTLTAGTVIAFMLWYGMFGMPVAGIAETYNVIQTAMASSERLFKLLDEEEIIKQRECARVVNHLKGHIEFRNVTFEYNPGEPVLHEVSFTIEPGQTVAIVGATGAGKSTIINLIFRFYDVSAGQVLVDGIDVRDYDMTSLRRQMSLVLQDVFIFSGTVAYNIRLGDEIPIEHVIESARMVNAHRFIEQLPEGYETVQSERGSTLSAGQRQLLSFARALAFHPSILVLDEATSNVDTETERLIQDAIEKLTRDRTSIIVAHRLSTVQRADQILVLHKGEVRERGTHQQLLKQRGLYYRLYQLQYKERQLARPDAEPADDVAS
ncbi:MAG: ABC transporter ATP-binding protein [Verrucomicrobia bacterium]|nr:ABC transporter ATP-binding protein [Verrucomicrobiota bacterium]